MDQGSGLRFGVLSLGFVVWGLGFRIQGSGFRVQGSGFRVQGSGFRVQGSEFRCSGPGTSAEVRQETEYLNDLDVEQLLAHFLVVLPLREIIPAE